MHVKLGHPHGEYALAVYNIEGRMVKMYNTMFEAGNDEIKVDMTHLQPGMYIIELKNTDGGTPLRGKFIKQ